MKLRLTASWLPCGLLLLLLCVGCATPEEKACRNLVELFFKENPTLAANTFGDVDQAHDFCEDLSDLVHGMHDCMKNAKNTKHLQRCNGIGVRWWARHQQQIEKINHACQQDQRLNKIRNAFRRLP